MSLSHAIRISLPLLLALALGCAGAGSPEQDGSPPLAPPSTAVERAPEPGPAPLYEPGPDRAERRARAALRRAALEEELLQVQRKRQLTERALRSAAPAPMEVDLEALREAGERRLRAARELARAEHALREARL